MFLVQKWLVFQLFFLGNIGQENVSDYILERKNSFLGYKNKKFKQLKNCHFSKGVNLWFWSKKGHFPTFFLGNIGQENVFYDIVERKRVNLHGFCPKMAIFEIFFRQYRPVKCLLRHSRSKKRLSRL